MTYSIIDVTNQVGLGTILTILGLIALFYAIRSNYANIQSNQIRTLERQIGVDKGLLKDAEREVTKIRADLAEQRAKTDLSGLKAALDSEFEWKRSALEGIEQGIRESRDEHKLIVNSLHEISETLRMIAVYTKGTP